MEKQIAHLMTMLKCTREEALDIIATDKRIDKGEKLFELSADQKQASKEARQAPRTPTVYKFTQREKKANPTKADLCSAMIKGLTEFGIVDLEVANAEREFSFTYGGTKYKVTLACPRK